MRTSDGPMPVTRQIVKQPGALVLRPNLLDHAATCRTFHWDEAARGLDGLPAGGLNIAHEAIDRHVVNGRGRRTAICWLGKSGERREISYGDLAAATNRFANALHALRVAPGERVFVLMGRLPELYVAALGALKAHCVVAPLFSAFGPEPIATRAEMGDARVLVTRPELYRCKVQGQRTRLAGLKHVICVGDATEPGTLRWSDIMAAASAKCTIAATDPESMSPLHFTSGTTGRPKGAMHVHAAVLAHLTTGRYALYLHDSDVFWCTADPGWITGTSYRIITLRFNGLTNVVVEAEFDAPTWYAAPTAIRMMMKLGTGALAGRDLSALRFMASVGEPLNPEAVVWGLDAFGLPFHDNWWQTETGGIMIANYVAMDVRPASMGKQSQGITAMTVCRDNGGLTLVDSQIIEGELAPEADLFRVGDGEHLREVLDLDSMDFLSFIVALSQKSGRKIPAADTGRLYTLRGLVLQLANPPDAA